MLPCFWNHQCFWSWIWWSSTTSDPQGWECNRNKVCRGMEKLRTSQIVWTQHPSGGERWYSLCIIFHSEAANLCFLLLFNWEPMCFVSRLPTFSGPETIADISNWYWHGSPGAQGSFQNVTDIQDPREGLYFLFDFSFLFFSFILFYRAWPSPVTPLSKFPGHRTCSVLRLRTLIFVYPRIVLCGRIFISRLLRTSHLDFPKTPLVSPSPSLPWLSYTKSPAPPKR